VCACVHARTRVCVCDLETSRMRRPWPTGGCCAKNKKENQPFNSEYSLIYKEQKVINLLLFAVLLSSLRATAMIGSRDVLHHNYERKCKVCKVPCQDMLHAVHGAFDKNRCNTVPPVQNSKHMYPREGQGQTHKPYVLAAYIIIVWD
jgi:hypothetical protein